MPREFYLRSVHKRWQQVLATSRETAVVFSPYLTPKTALNVIQVAAPDRCAIYTRFSMEDFASGASSLFVLKSLVKNGNAVFEVPALHAKILVVSKLFASVGSQNMTARGVRNREATYCTDVEAEVAQIEQMLIPWQEIAVPITSEMVEDAIRLLPPIQKAFRVVQRAASAADAEIRALHEDRLAANKRELNQRSAEARVRHEIANIARSKIVNLLPNDQVSCELAQMFIRRSTFWHSHSSGQIVSGRGHANRVYGWGSDWKVNFGANSFLVGRAIYRCMQTLRGYIDSWEAGEPLTASEVVRRLRRNVNGGVAGHNGVELNGYYPLTGNDMMFGTTSINVRSFVKALLELMPISIINELQDSNKIHVGL